MASIKIVHVTTVPQSLFFLRGQVGYMKERGFDIHGLSSPGEFLSRFAEQECVAVHPVDMPRRITPLRDLVAVAAIWKVLRTIRPQIVHAHTPKGGVLGMVAAWLARTPVRMYHMRGLPFTTASGWKRVLLIWSERISCGLADQVFCVSASIRQVALEAGLCRSEKIAVLARGSGNGVDAAQRFNGTQVASSVREETRRRYSIPADALVVGFIGRIVRSKGIVELAGAWTRLRDAFPQLHLLLVGPYEPQDPIPPEVDAGLRQDPRVHLIGEEWNTPPLYAAMDVLASADVPRRLSECVAGGGRNDGPGRGDSRARLRRCGSGRRDREIGSTLRFRTSWPPRSRTTWVIRNSVVVTERRRETGCCGSFARKASGRPFIKNTCVVCAARASTGGRSWVRTRSGVNAESDHVPVPNA
jgi:glycosyltransferase involved in cell wall biosynthesis